MVTGEAIRRLTRKFMPVISSEPNPDPGLMEAGSARRHKRNASPSPNSNRSSSAAQTPRYSSQATVASRKERRLPKGLLFSGTTAVRLRGKGAGSWSTGFDGLKSEWETHGMEKRSPVARTGSGVREASGNGAVEGLDGPAGQRSTVCVQGCVGKLIA